MELVKKLDGIHLSWASFYSIDSPDRCEYNQKGIYHPSTFWAVVAVQIILALLVQKLGRRLTTVHAGIVRFDKDFFNFPVLDPQGISLASRSSKYGRAIECEI